MMTLFLQLVYHCHPYIFLILYISYEFSVHSQYVFCSKVVGLLFYVYSLAGNKIPSNGKPVYFRVETLRSTFHFAKIEIAGAVPQKIS